MPSTELTLTDPTAFHQQSTSHNKLTSPPFSNLFNTSNAMIRHSSLEANSHPGLSFFCKSDNTLKYQKEEQEKVERFEKSLQPPLVISRLNISRNKPTVKNGFTDLDDENTPPTSPQPITVKHSTFFNFASAFKPGFGSVGMLRGNKQLDEARVNRKIEDLEIEKNSLLTLNQTLESVVKQQSNTIQDLQTKLAAIEGPLKPGLDKTLNIEGVMSTSSVESAENVDDEDAAFERIRTMLLQLIEQAQSAVLEEQQVIPQQGMTRKNQRPRSIDKRPTESGNRIISRRSSVTSTHSLYTANPTATTTNKRRSLQATTPTPNHRRLQRSVSRSSSPAVLVSDDRCPSPTPSVRSNTKKRIKEQPAARKWQN